MPSGHTPSPPSDGPLQLTTLGGAALTAFSTEHGPTAVLGPGKPLALLIYLAFSPGRTASREHLIDLLWSDLEPERGKHALRQTVYFLRHHLGERALLGHAGELEVAVPLEIDRDAFLDAVEHGDLDLAVQLYAGSFLPGFASPGGAEFEQWADLERERLRGIFVRTAETLARRHLSTHSFREAQRLARRIRDEDPLNESNWRLLIETLVSANDTLAAAIEADALTALLKAEGREPEPATRASLRLARQRPSGNEPEPASRGLMAELVGREREFAAIIRAWEEARRGRSRHVHVSAPAGLGKTRLLADVQGRLRASAACVCALRAKPGDRRIAYSLAGELAGAVGTLPGAAGISPSAASALVALHPGLSSQFAAAVDTSTGDEALRRRAIAIAELLAAVADEAPIALLVDDIHWADSTSQLLLQVALDRLQNAAVLLVTTSRPTRDAAVEGPAATRLTLAPLSVEQVGELLASLGALPRDDWARSLTVALHATSGGTPLLVLETLQLSLDRGSIVLGPDGWSCTDPVFLITELQAGGALRHRMSQLEPEEREMLLLLATAGAPLTLGQLSSTVGDSPDRLESALAGLERRGFVSRSGGDWEVAHDQIGEMALEMAAPSEATAAHAALGPVLAADVELQPRLVPRAVHHFAAAGDESELARLFERWLTLAERRGDRRPPRVLAAEFLGEYATNTRIAALSAGLPWWRRTLRTPARRGLAAAVVFLACAAVASAALRDTVESDPETMLFAFRGPGRDTSGVVGLPVRYALLDDARQLDLDGGRTVARLGNGARIVATPRASPDGRTWVYPVRMTDSGETDLVSRDRFGRETRLTSTPGPDLDPSWSPDGHLLVLSTGRWAPRGGDDADLGIIEPSTGRIRQLTSGRADDVSSRWSRDGTRIAYVRRFADLRPNELCWITTDGLTARCFPPADYEIVSILGWYDPHQVVALADAGDRQLLVRFDLEQHNAAVLEPGPVNQATMSLDGEWIACHCQRPGDATASWYIYPAREPQRVRRLGGTAEGQTTFFWGSTGRPLAYLDRFDIVPPTEDVPVDATYRLRVTGLAVNGSTVPLAAATLRWRSADPSVAEVDRELGSVRPKRPGRVLIYASAGGWRRDSVALTIGAPGSHGRLMESWDGETTRWLEFGDPAPRIVDGPDGVRAFWNAGDRSFSSGVFSVDSFDARRGLSLEARLSTPVDRPLGQSLRVSLTPAPDPEALVLWTSHGGNAPAVTSLQLGACGLNYPGGEGPSALRRFVLTADAAQRRIPTDSGITDGHWYTIRIQIFSDGTCGFAINGVPVWRSGPESALSLRGPFHVVLQGSSVDTRMLVGPLEVWDGVKGDVDWTSLEGGAAVAGRN